MHLKYRDGVQTEYGKNRTVVGALSTEKNKEYKGKWYRVSRGVDGSDGQQTRC